MLNGICPQCGKELQVPQELEEFSCLYCGARLTKEKLLREKPVQSADAQAFAQVLPLMAGLVRGYRGYQKKITRGEFESAFESYESGTWQTFALLDHGTAGDESRMTQAAERLLDDLEADWANAKKTDRRIVMDTDKIVIAIFLVPALRRRKLAVSESFCQILQKKWCERHPKDPFYLGDYDDIAGGFRKRLFGLCFITTAVCEAEGKPDDCEELTAFRRFRDGWLRQQPDGQALIEEYYDIAPGIVTCIDLASDRMRKYADIRTRYLDPCFGDLQAGQFESCKARYVQMVRDLEKEYLS